MITGFYLVTSAALHQKWSKRLPLLIFTGENSKQDYNSGLYKYLQKTYSCHMLNQHILKLDSPFFCYCLHTFINEMPKGARGK